MTVKELIKALQDAPKDAEVVMPIEWQGPNIWSVKKIELKTLINIGEDNNDFVEVDAIENRLNKELKWGSKNTDAIEMLKKILSLPKTCTIMIDT